MRQIGPLFGISHAAAHRVIDKAGPLLALAHERRIDSVAIVDGTLVPTKCGKILRDYRRAAGTLADAVSASPTSTTSHSPPDEHHKDPTRSSTT